MVDDLGQVLEQVRDGAEVRVLAQRLEYGTLSLAAHVALGLLLLGLVIAHPEFVAPAINSNVPADAPPIFPFLFITIACGAVSGFHCLVASGTSSKQLYSEADAQFVGYGSMLLEGGLAVLVILACCAGLGLGVYEMSGGQFTRIVDTAGAPLAGRAAWDH